MFKIVRCPESEQLELVECVETPLGSLIHRCSRFRPACAMKCTRRCAVTLDQSASMEAGPIREREGHLELDCELDDVEDTR